jgi:hypothetical protein
MDRLKEEAVIPDVLDTVPGQDLEVSVILFKMKNNPFDIYFNF